MLYESSQRGAEREYDVYPSCSAESIWIVLGFRHIESYNQGFVVKENAEDPSSNGEAQRAEGLSTQAPLDEHTDTYLLFLGSPDSSTVSHQCQNAI